MHHDRDVLHEILQKPTDIYYFNRDILVCAMHICVYTRIYCDIRIYTTSTKYKLVYTLMSYLYMSIYSYILWYTDIYYFNSVYTSSCIYSYVLCLSVYIRPIRHFPWDFHWDFHWDFLKSNALVYLFLEISATSADIRKLSYFITLVRGCPGLQVVSFLRELR